MKIILTIAALIVLCSCATPPPTAHYFPPQSSAMLFVNGQPVPQFSIYPCTNCVPVCTNLADCPPVPNVTNIPVMSFRAPTNIANFDLCQILAVLQAKDGLDVSVWQNIATNAEPCLSPPYWITFTNVPVDPTQPSMFFRSQFSQRP